ncbi:MAG: hypothetical protein M0022_04100 [Desulfobacteraceae bacterium]|nr:hypothetical protein [Desulfobacteraceae bacterium]
MNISPYHIQNVIRSYTQHIKKRRGPTENPGPDQKTDIISISNEGREINLEKISNDALSLGNKNGNDLEIARRLMDRLGAKLNSRTEPSSVSLQNTGFKFKIVNSAKEETIKELSLDNIKKIWASKQTI